MQDEIDDIVKTVKYKITEATDNINGSIRGNGFGFLKAPNEEQKRQEIEFINLTRDAIIKLTEKMLSRYTK